MKKINKIIILITSLFFITKISSMDKDIMRSMDDNQYNAFTWNELPVEIKKEILKEHVKSLILTRKFDEETQKNINDLKFTNQEIYNFINDPFLVKNVTAEINKDYKCPIFLFAVARSLLSKQDYLNFQERFINHKCLNLQKFKFDGSEKEKELWQRFLDNLVEKWESQIIREKYSLLFPVYELSENFYHLMEEDKANLNNEELLQRDNLIQKFRQIILDHENITIEANKNLLQKIKFYKNVNTDLSFESNTEKYLSAFGRIVLLSDLKVWEKITNLTCLDAHHKLLYHFSNRKKITGFFINFFLKVGAKMKNENKTKLLMAAIKVGEIDIVADLIIHTNLNYPNRSGPTPLSVALRHNRFEIAKMLIESGADVNYFDYDHRSYFNALRNGQAVKHIDYDNTPLIIALSNRQFDMVKILLTKKATITPLAHAYILEWYYDAVKNNDLETQLFFSPYLSLSEIAAGALPDKCVIS